MQRRHLFEFNESARCPASIRHAITRLLQWGSTCVPLYRAAIPLVLELLEEQGAKEVVDLGSGSGGPWPALLNEPGFEFVRLTLTDGALDPSVLEAFPDEQRSRVELGPQTENLLCSEDLPGLRTAFACLHHLEPDELEEMLAEVANGPHPFLGVEVTERMPSAIARQLLLFPVALAGVLFIRPTLAQLLLTYLVPVIPLALVWDGVISCLRAYHPDELLRHAQRHAPSHYRWRAARVRHPSSPTHIVYLEGRREVGGASLKQGGG